MTLLLKKYIIIIIMHFLFYLIKPQIIKQNWNQFLLVVKPIALKQQISKFYPEILSTETSFYIYDRPLTDTYVIARLCA